MSTIKPLKIIYKRGYSSINRAVMAGFNAFENKYQQLSATKEIIFFVYQDRDRYYYTSSFIGGLQTHAKNIPAINNFITGVTILVAIAHSHPPYSLNKHVEISFSTLDINTFKVNSKNNHKFSFYLRTINGNVLKLHSSTFSLGFQTITTRKSTSRKGKVKIIQQRRRHYGYSICPNRKHCLPVYQKQFIKAKAWKNPDAI